jgi:tetratricopeptide (TPR) repeat protein
MAMKSFALKATCFLFAILHFSSVQAVIDQDSTQVPLENCFGVSIGCTLLDLSEQPQLNVPLSADFFRDEEDMLMSAFSLAEDNQLNAATSLTTQFLAQQPDHAFALYLLGHLQFLNDDPQSSKDNLTKSLQLDDTNDMAWFIRALLHLADENYSLALAGLDKTLNIDPHFESALSIKATILIITGEIEAGYNLFEQALKDTSQPETFYMLRGFISLETGRLPIAAIDLEKAAQHPDTAASAHGFLGKLYLMQENYSAAIASLNKAIELDDTAPEYFGWRGEAHFALSHWPETQADLEVYLQEDTDNTYIQIRLAIAYYGQENFKASLAPVQMILQEQPENSAILHFSYQLYLKLGAQADALNAIEQAIRFDPENTKHRLAQIDLLIDMKQLTRALEVIDEALADLGSLYELDVRKLKQLVAHGDLSASADQAIFMLGEAYDLSDEAQLMLRLVDSLQTEAMWPQADALLQGAVAIYEADDQTKFLQAASAAHAGDLTLAKDFMDQFEQIFGVASYKADRRFENLWTDTQYTHLFDTTYLYSKMLVTLNADRQGEIQDANLHNRTAYALRQVGCTSAAIDYLSKLIERTDEFDNRESNEVWFYNELSLSHQALRRQDEAIQAYRQGIKRVGTQNRQVISIVINFADYLMRSGNYAEAITYADMGEDIGASPYGKTLFHGIRAVSYQRLNQPTQSNYYLLQALKTGAKAPHILLEMYLRLGQTDEANRLFEQIARNPDFFDILLDYLVLPLEGETRLAFDETEEAAKYAIVSAPAMARLWQDKARIVANDSPKSCTLSPDHIAKYTSLPVKPEMEAP